MLKINDCLMNCKDQGELKILLWSKETDYQRNECIFVFYFVTDYFKYNLKLHIV